MVSSKWIYNMTYMGKEKKLMKLNVGSLKSIYLIMWWLTVLEINFPLHLEKIQLKWFFWFPMFRILKSRLKRTNISIDFFSRT